MRSSIFVLLSTVALLGSGSVALADPPATSSPDTVSVGTNQSDPNEVICKTLAPETGTRLGPRRECQTRHEWDMQQQQSQRELLQKQNGGSLAVPGG